MTFAKTKNRLAAAAAVPVRILILPKFEMGEITGDFPGEAQFFYEEYLAFDFSDAYILSVGCGGSAEGYGIFGDVYVITASVGFDLGHHADPREMTDQRDTTWFRDHWLDESGVVRLDEDLTGPRICAAERRTASDYRKNRGSSQKRVSERSMGGPAAAGSARNLRHRG